MTEYESFELALPRCSLEDLLLDRVVGDHAVGDDGLRLSDPVSSGEGLEILLGVPVAVEEDYSVGRAEAAGEEGSEFALWNEGATHLIPTPPARVERRKM